MKITINDVERFMDVIGKDRQWLADEIGCSRGTLNNWFSAKTFPLWAEKSISRILADYEKSTKLDASGLKFSLAEWAMLQQATEISGARSVEEFILHALRDVSGQIINEKSQPPKSESSE